MKIIINVNIQSFRKKKFSYEFEYSLFEILLGFEWTSRLALSSFKLDIDKRSKPASLLFDEIKRRKDSLIMMNQTKKEVIK